ncbi:MAG: hypothetical protein HZB43_10330 [candidate division Zixibacteria bacterium]|nr:hypothetical protein [candidate division Zixibacteria bacterium]
MAKQSMSTINVTPGASGFKVTKVKYDCIREAILANLPSSKEGLKFNELVSKIKREVGSRKDLFPKAGSVMWYTKVVQLDLEKRRVIERIPEAVPQRLRRLK